MFDEKKVAAARDTLLATCKELNAKSIISSWTFLDGTKVELAFTILPLDDVEDDELEEKLRVYAPAAVRKFGQDSQIDQAIEEMSELITALQKYKRATCANLPDAKNRDAVRAAAKDHVQEEMSDVKIMMAQLAEIFGFSREWEVRKLSHLRTLVTGDKG